MTRPSASRLLMVIVAATVGIPAMSPAQQTAPSTSSQTPAIVTPKMPGIPSSTVCTTSRPCQNVTGEIVRIEESYWVKDLNGQEVHMRVTGDTKLESLPRVGDKVAAQVTSDGKADTVIKVPAIQQPQVPVPSKNYQDLR